jgi:hypothetical protein
MNVRRAMKLIVRSFSAVPSETLNIKKRRGSCSLMVTEARGAVNVLAWNLKLPFVFFS